MNSGTHLTTQFTLGPRPNIRPIGSETDPISLLVFIVVVGGRSSKKPNAPSFQIESGWNLARLFFNYDEVGCLVYFQVPPMTSAAGLARRTSVGRGGWRLVVRGICMRRHWCQFQKDRSKISQLWGVKVYHSSRKRVKQSKKRKKSRFFGFSKKRKKT